MPWLLCFTGARIDEIAELQRKHVRREAGVWILDICPTAQRRGKNATFQRMLPVHPALVAEGFLHYVEALPRDGDASLFPDLLPASDGSRGRTATTVHGRWVRKRVGITDRRKAPAHSWRHRMEDQLRIVRALPEVQDAITGRHNPRNAGAGYGKGFRAMPEETLKELRRVPSPLDAVPAL
jgi:integrase